jgi:hypothetical protein
MKDFGMITATRVAAKLGVATFQMQAVHRECPQNIYSPTPISEPHCYCKINILGYKLSGFLFNSIFISFLP